MPRGTRRQRREATAARTAISLSTTRGRGRGRGSARTSSAPYQNAVTPGRGRRPRRVATLPSTREASGSDPADDAQSSMNDLEYLQSIVRSEIQQAFANFASSSAGGTPASTQSTTDSLVHTPPTSSSSTSIPQVSVSTSQSPGELVLGWARRAVHACLCIPFSQWAWVGVVIYNKHGWVWLYTMGSGGCTYGTGLCICSWVYNWLCVHSCTMLMLPIC